MNAHTILPYGLALAASLVIAAPAAMAGGESPFACNASALSPAERKQHFEEYGPKLRTQLQSIHELPNGYEFEFADRADTYRLLASWMYQERLCCPFFDLDLVIDREGGPLRLRLTGRDGVKEFITAEFEPWFAAQAARR